jgi:hypothetical protein
MLSKEQRRALYDLCSIFHLTFYEKEMRIAAQNLRELLRKNTLDGNRNKCEFDLTERDKKLLSSPSTIKK